MKQAMSFVFPVMMVVGLVVSAFVIVTALQAAPSATNGNGSGGPIEMAQVDPVAHGKALFVAKGCIVCHVNQRVTAIREGLMDMSDVPNLTTVKADPAYLRRWLKDPSVMKPGTEMPNLHLTDAEIDALTAFLLAGSE